MQRNEPVKDPPGPEDLGEGDLSSLEAAEAVLQKLAVVFFSNPAQLFAETPKAVTPPPQRRKSSRPAFRMAESRYRTLIEQIPVVTFMAMLDGGLNEAYVSPQIETMLGYSQEEWLENPVLWYQRLHPDDKSRWNTEFARVVTTGEAFGAIYRFLAKDGHVVWIRGEGQIVRNEQGVPMYVQGVGFDVTEIKEAEARLEESLKEKELLLREIHHRVKNNLQITAGLFSLQASMLSDEATITIFRESENRIQSMALVHEMLYQTSSLARIDLAEYAENLTRNVLRSYSARSAQLELTFDLCNVLVNIDTAIPFGLILNELIGNCVKHAFSSGESGRVWVSLKIEGEAVLAVIDDGRGVPPDLNIRKTTSLGLQLVHTLTRQLKGRIELIRSPLTEFRLTFPL